MKKTLLISLSVLTLYSCGKDDKKTPLPPEEKTYYNHQFPDFSCTDNNDDGKFEQWTDTVKKTICRNCTYPDTANESNIDTLALSGNKVSKYGKSFPSLHIRTRQTMTLKMYLVQKDNDKQYAWEIKVNKNSDLKREISDMGTLDKMNAGCARLYYHLTEYTASLVQIKGHFDIEIAE